MPSSGFYQRLHNVQIFPTSFLGPALAHLSNALQEVVITRITEYYLDLLFDSPYDGDSGVHNALCASAQEGHLDIVRLCLDPKYQVLLSSLEIQAMIGKVVPGDHTIIIELLINSREKGSKIPLDSKDFLEAAYYGRLDLVRLFLDIGAGAAEDILGIERNCRYALNRAASHGHVHIVEFLLTRYERFLTREDKNFAVCSAIRLGSQRVVHKLFQYGAHNDEQGECWPPLVEAAFYGQAGMVDFLMHKTNGRAHPDVVVRALVMAANANSASTIRVLARYGFVVGAIDQQDRIMSKARRKGDHEVIQALFDMGIKGSETPAQTKSTL